MQHTDGAAMKQQRYCLFKTQTHILNVQTAELTHLPDLMAVTESCGSNGDCRVPPSRWSPHQVSVTQQALCGQKNLHIHIIRVRSAG